MAIKRNALALVPPRQPPALRAAEEPPASPPAVVPAPVLTTSTPAWQAHFADIRSVLVPIAGQAAGRAAVNGLIAPRPDHEALDRFAAQGVAAAASLATDPSVPPEVRLAATGMLTTQVGVVAAANERREQRRDRDKRKLVAGGVWTVVVGGLAAMIWKGIT